MSLPKEVYKTAKEIQPWKKYGSQQILLLKEQMDAQYQLNEWDNKRVDKLCLLTGVTLEQLCGAAGVFGIKMIRGLRRRSDMNEAREKAIQEARHKLNPRSRWKTYIIPKWPPEIALHFARIERFFIEQKLQVPVPPGPDDAFVAQLLCSPPPNDLKK